MAEGFRIAQAFVEIESEDDTASGLASVGNSVTRWGQRLGDRVTSMMGGWFRAGTREAAEELDKLRAETERKLEDISAKKLQIDADVLHAEDKIRSLKKLAQEATDDHEKLVIEADVAAAEAKLILLRRQADKLTREHHEIKIDVDRLAARAVTEVATGLVGLLKRASQHAADFGMSMASSLSAAATSGTSMTVATGGINLLVGAILIAVGALAMLYTGFITLAPAVFLAGGAVGALATALAGGIATAAVFKLGMNGISDAFEEISKDGKATEETLAKLSPSARAFVKAFEGIQKPLNELKKSVQERLFSGMADSFKDLAGKWLPAARTMLGDLAGTLNSIGRSIMAAFGDATFINNMKIAVAGFGSMLTTIGNSIPGLIGAFGRLAAGSVPFLQTIGELVAGLINKFSAWVQKIDESGRLKSFMEQASDALRDVWAIGGLVVAIGKDIVEIFFPGSVRTSGTFLDGVKAMLTDVHEWLNNPDNQRKIQEWITKIQDFMDKVATEWIPKAIEWSMKVEGWINKVKGWIDAVASIPDKIGEAWDRVKTWTEEKWNAIVGFFTSLPGRIGAAISALPGTVLGIISNMATTVAGAVGFFIGSVIGFFIALPFRVAEAIVSLPGIVSNAFNSAKDWAISHASSLVSSVGNWFSQLPGRISSAVSALPGMVSNAFNSAKNAAVSAASALVNSAISTISSIPGRAASALGGLGGVLVGAGRALIQGLINGIESQLGALRSKLGSVTSMIPDWKGPLDTDKKLLVPAGSAIMGGLMAGIDSRVPELADQLRGLTTQIGGMGSTMGRRGSGGAVYNFHPGSITIDPTKIKTLEDLVKLVQAITPTSRQFGARGALA